jgi:ABC-2 type transport system permease protein
MMNYLFPLVFFLLVSGLMASLNPVFKELMLPAMTIFAIMASALLSLPAILVNARESGVFRSFRINGVPSASLLAIPPLGGLVHMAVVGALIAVIGPRLYGGLSPTNMLGYAVAGLLSYTAMASVGALIGVAAGNNRATTLIGQLVYLPSILLGGLMVPSAALPPALARVSLLLPASHGMRVFATLGMGTGSEPLPWLSLVVLATGSILAFGLAALIFQWDSRMSQPNRRAGLAVLAIVPYAVAALVG